MRKEEIWKFLIASQKVSKKDFLYVLRNKFENKNNLFFLPGKKYLVSERFLRMEESRKKEKKARKITKILSFIPTVLLLGISGSLSLENAKKTDDIDIFIITRKNTLWITRAIVLLLLIVLGEKRASGEKFAKDKICPNMFMSESALFFSKEKQNLFTAHEIAQLKIFVNKSNIYERFLQSNSWILDFMPNCARIKKNFSYKNSLNDLIFAFFYPIEFLLRLMQRIYMHKKITKEIVGKNIAQFHPIDMKKYVLELYSLRCLYILGKKSPEIDDYSRILT